MKTKMTPTGLGQPVRPLIRILAALIVVAGPITLVLHATLIYFDAPGYRLEMRAVPVLLLCAMFAAYGISIAFRGRAPVGLLPWK